ncbi:MAG: hypothetical protein EB100_03805, partial [Crocinitomicaceae bacterium]|nr:hypothetical protein [Crocinitomicaceae bacterium]
AVGTDICHPKYYTSKTLAENAAISGVSDAQIDIKSLGLKIQSQKTSKICYQYTSKSNETKIGVKFFLGLSNNTGAAICMGDRKYSVVSNCDGSSLPLSTTTPAGFYEYEVKPATKYSICLEVAKESGCNSDSTKIEISELYMYNAGNYCLGNIGNISVIGGKSKNNTEYDLFNGDTINIKASNYVLPKLTDGSSPGFGYMVFSELPSLPFTDVTPSAINLLPGYKGIVSGATLTDVNKLNSSSSIPGQSVLWYIPAIFDNIIGERKLDSDLDRCVVLGTPIKVNYNPNNTVQCGSCETPNCPVNQVPFFENRDYTKGCNVLPSEISGATYYSYHLVKSDSLGGLGLVQLISTSNFNGQYDIKRNAVLRPYGNSCDTSLSIQPTVLNANNISSGFNPEWRNLKPLTNYVAIIKTEIPTTQPYVSGCLNAYGIKSPCSQSALSIIGKDSLCENEKAIVSPSIKGGKWTLSSTIASMIGDTIKAVKSGTITLNYEVQGLDACKSVIFKATKKIIIKQSPIVSEILGASKLCEGDLPVVYTNQTIGGTWSSSNPIVAAIATPSSTVKPGSVAPKTPGVVFVNYSLTDKLNNCTTTKFKQVVVFARPKAPTLAGLDSLCIGSTISVIPSIKGGVWSTNNTSYITLDQGYVNGIASGTARIDYTIKNDSTSCITSASKNIQVKSAPIINILGSDAVCVGNSIKLTCSVKEGSWLSDLTSSMTVTDGVVKGLKEGVSTIRFIYNVPGCVSMASKKITVEALPTVTITGPSKICWNGKAMFRASVAGGIWAPENSALILSSTQGLFRNGEKPSVDNFKSGVSYTLNSKLGACANKVVKNVYVRNVISPSVIISSQKTTLKLNETVTAIANTVNPASGSWSTTNTLTSVTALSNSKNASVKGLRVGTGSNVVYFADDVTTGCRFSNWLTFNVSFAQSIVDNTDEKIQSEVNLYPNPTK